jgi:dephospho-CoA kinase
MLIGISGKIGSGKDTVGKIIQSLNKTPNISSKEFIKQYLYNDVKDSEFIIRKFADKLKDIVCLLLNCSREELEDREFKERELGKEWWYYKGEKNYII